jgi:hypothetical protein
MRISTRIKFGAWLVAISMAALVAFFAIGISRGAWHYVGSGSTGNGEWIDFSGKLGLGGYCLVPISLCGAVGMVCLLWPSRKPPVLNR